MKKLSLRPSSKVDPKRNKKLVKLTKIKSKKRVRIIICLPKTMLLKVGKKESCIKA
jgi:hypothetical protein